MDGVNKCSYCGDDIFQGKTLIVKDKKTGLTKEVHFCNSCYGIVVDKLIEAGFVEK